ncbi:MAG: hypothetical protein J7539_13035 [Niabella sp.]|nr:hypothetical protein [Niabella sp.]
MKARLNITIDQMALKNIKAYAAAKQISVSELVEAYFKKVTRPARKKNIISLIDKLEAPSFDNKADLKELFYKEQMDKYGI